MTKGIKKVKTPGNRLSIHSSVKATPKAHCYLCGNVLSVNTAKKTISGKRPSRPYGGKVCHLCLIKAIESTELS